MCHSFSSTSPVWTAVSLILAVVHLTKGNDFVCGGFLEVNNFPRSGLITSPNFPAVYSHESNCIWLVQGPSGRTLRLNVFSLNAESSNGACVDYLEVRAGSGTAVLLYNGCSLSSSITIESPNRWLWIRFVSNQETAFTGFNSTWETTDTPENATYTKNPQIVCHTTHLYCPNRECIEKSWICDGLNDCGCTTWGCDESDCSTEKIHLAIRFTVGITLGIIVFILAVFLAIWRERINPWPPFKKSEQTPVKK